VYSRLRAVWHGPGWAIIHDEMLKHACYVVGDCEEDSRWTRGRDAKPTQLSIASM